MFGEPGGDNIMQVSKIFLKTKIPNIIRAVWQKNIKETKHTIIRQVVSFILALFILTPFTGHSAEMANVGYVHDTLKWRWDIDLPYNSELTNPSIAANMKYLLTVIDIANEYLNDEKTTDYANSEYATMAAADTIATATAIDALIRGPGFYLSTIPSTTNFSITISAAGNFAIDWGDGTRESIVDKPVGKQTYSHTFANSQRSNTIRITGTATEYMNSQSGPTISFSSTSNIAQISGNLGKIFPTLENGDNPSFHYLFTDAVNMTGEIPPDLFNGIYGQGTYYMFGSLFDNCPKLTGEIPPDLFGGITGPLDKGVFEATFRGATGLTGSIPEQLFSRINSATKLAQFNQTFKGCSGLTGTIPGKLFQGIYGPPQEALFYSTFRNCTGIGGSIPGELFAGISGAPADSAFADTFAYMGLSGKIPGELFAGVRGAPAYQIFSYTFAGNRNLSGPIPGELFAGISGAPATNMFAYTFFQCSGLGGAIPEDLFAGIHGEPAGGMFRSTFSDAGVTSIPENFFTGISGAPADGMFRETFSWNWNLRKIPDKLFSGISGEPAQYMYAGTFLNTSVESIPLGLFGDISGSYAKNMFLSTFDNCVALTGPSARMPDGQYLYDAFPNIPDDMGTYANSQNLDDYAQIPENWK